MQVSNFLEGSTTASRSGAPRLTGGPAPSCRQHVEADLAKMTVGSDHGRYLQLAHDRKAGAVRERQVLVSIVEEEVPGSFETIGLDTFPSQPGAAFDLPPACIGGGQPEAKANQCQRLVDDTVLVIKMRPASSMVSRAAVQARCAGSLRSAQAIQPPVSTNTGFIVGTRSRRDRQTYVRHPMTRRAWHGRAYRPRARSKPHRDRRLAQSEMPAGYDRSR